MWPLCETLHYLGLSMLLGAVSFFDLRVLGLAKGIPLRALHRLIPWGIGGYLVNILTGIVFFAGHPDQYFYNNAFRFKVLFMMVAAINVLAFYGTNAFAEMKTLAAAAEAPLRIKMIAGVSLTMWVAVLVCGPPPDLFPPAILSLTVHAAALPAFHPAANCTAIRSERTRIVTAAIQEPRCVPET